MRSGELRHRVTIQRYVSYLGSWGRESVWRDICTVWAEVKPTSAAERFAEKGVNASTAYTVRLRYRPDLTSNDRLSYGGLVLDMTGVTDPDGRRRELVCTCVEHGSGEAAA